MTTKKGLSVILGAIGLAGAAQAEPPRTLPEKAPVETTISYQSYWGNARRQGSGGALDLSFAEEGCRYKSREQGAAPAEFAFTISRDKFQSLYAFVRAHQVEKLPVKEQRVHDGFGNTTIRVVAPVDVTAERRLELEQSNNSNHSISDPRWSEVVERLTALGGAARARADKEGISHFTLIKDPNLGNRSAYAYFVGQRGSLENVPVLPGTYKLRVGVWPEGMTVYDQKKLTFVERDVELPKVKQLRIRATSTSVELVDTP